MLSEIFQPPETEETKSRAQFPHGALFCQSSLSCIRGRERPTLTVSPFFFSIFYVLAAPSFPPHVTTFKQDEAEWGGVSMCPRLHYPFVPASWSPAHQKKQKNPRREGGERCVVTRALLCCLFKSEKELLYTLPATVHAPLLSRNPPLLFFARVS